MMKRSRKLSAAVSVILVIAFALAVTGCGGGGASAVVKTFFDAIDKQDVKAFLSCFQDDVVDMLTSFMDEDDIEEQLELLDELLADEFGKNWRKELKVGKAEEVDKDKDVTYYDVEFSIDDEEEYIQVIKVKGKYYLDDGAFDLF